MGLKNENVLIVDDDINILELIYRHLQSFNYHSYKAVSVKEALAILKDSRIDLLITDLKMPDVDGMQLINYVSEHYPKLPKLVVTGYPSVDDALNVLKSGAIDYLVKPFTKEELRQAVMKSFAENEQLLASPIAQTNSKSGGNEQYGELIGRSKAIKRVTSIIDRVKDNKATVLINGESGTGKELVARSVHYMGKFSRAPFIAVNCGAIPESLLEAELFGYAKGAFTGAQEQRSGLFQAADKGTLFLDEVGNASPAVQSKLLRALQEKEVIKVGSQKTEKIDLRVIAATNSDLLSMVQKGLFREDLYYRLTVVEINVPPLRERKEDLVLLVNKFLTKYGLEYKDRVVSITADALDLLMRYNWPGNIRELENVIQRSVIMCDKQIGLENLPDNLKVKINFSDDRLLPLREIEKQYILKVLEATGNNKSRAAEILQIDRKTLRQKIQ
ncbi:sigma-54-dependent transcriptional regulator [Arenibacter certesii]|uniref:DNA-binding response regulator n=1 Tax=Arenibacter certesii TaxID=228955 RepID=A0A918IL40_9FLAO|nr:sigma-54 dependent transcriptional regulator [Arenibacter certesii]GGW21784.1 DNA-binding response regulator [Arenibacter certesii]